MEPWHKTVLQCGPPFLACLGHLWEAVFRGLYYAQEFTWLFNYWVEELSIGALHHAAQGFKHENIFPKPQSYDRRATSESLSPQTLAQASLGSLPIRM